VGIIEDVIEAFGRLFGGIGQKIEGIKQATQEDQKKWLAEMDPGERALVELHAKARTEGIKAVVGDMLVAAKKPPENWGVWAWDKIGNPFSKIADTVIAAILPPEPVDFEKAKDSRNRLWALAIDLTTFIAALDLIAEAASVGVVKNIVGIAQLYISTFGLEGLVRATLAPAVEAAVTRPLRYGHNAQYLSEIPGAQDLIRFMVREVFDPKVREEYGQDLDYPAVFTDYMKQHGYNEFWAKAYWAAHWELPSIGEGFEMYHRGQIDLKTLETLLRTKDVMPYWRDKLVNIAYSLIPRVDLRRAWEAGSLTTSDLLERYRWLGYSPKDAEVMTTIAMRVSLQTEINALEAETRERFIKGYITIDQAKAELQALGYSPERIDLRISLFNLEAETKSKDEVVALLIEEYKKDIIASESELEGILDDVVVRKDVLSHIIFKAELAKYKKPKGIVSITTEGS